jgi:hypothetical protein
MTFTTVKPVLSHNLKNALVKIGSKEIVIGFENEGKYITF